MNHHERAILKSAGGKLHRKDIKDQQFCNFFPMSLQNAVIEERRRVRVKGLTQAQVEPCGCAG